jgi:hypothetical protein
MPKGWLSSALLLSACSTNPPPQDSPGPPQPTPVHGVTPGHKCDASRTGEFIGQAGTSETGRAIQKATKAAVMRWAPPGYMLTMDYREDRVTVHLGPDYKVTKIMCG